MSNGRGQQYGSASCSAGYILHQRLIPQHRQCTHREVLFLPQQLSGMGVIIFVSILQCKEPRSEPGAWPHLQHLLHRHGKVITLRFQNLGLFSFSEIKGVLPEIKPFVFAAWILLPFLECLHDHKPMMAFRVCLSAPPPRPRSRLSVDCQGSQS